MIENRGNGWKVYCGNCLDVMAAIPDNSIDSIVTDPPYGLSFMGKRWDYDVPSVEIWAECLRVLKPGGHLLAFAGTRTQHRMAVRIEDAGFEIRDMIAWVYGSGFPKSLDVSKAIDGKDGRLGWSSPNSGKYGGHGQGMGRPGTKRMPNVNVLIESASARQWQGWGTALKPALEPITVARKPLIGTVAENVLAHGTGALNVDGCRVKGAMTGTWGARQASSIGYGGTDPDGYQTQQHPLGRWPANMIHDGSDEVFGLFPVTTSGNLSPHHILKASDNRSMSGGNQARNPRNEFGGDTGSAARFFYCAKASKRDRGEGNSHPTVKPTDLMRYLCRLVTPPGGTVFDPFMGSGSTGKAATLEGFSFIGAEMQREYFDIAASRIGKKESIQQGLL